MTSRRLLVLAAVLSMIGQLSAIVFMLAPNPFSTFFFMTIGVGMIFMGIAIFAYVMFRDIRERTESITEKEFRAGEHVFRQGDTGDRVYVVKDGEVEVVREDGDGGRRVLARLGEGEYFGEMALLSEAPRNASVVALTDVKVLAISHRDFQSLFSGIPALRQSIDAVMAQRSE
ncbi:MAG: cyclic nucleotide-binding domain-containing protein [Thermoanaerobaculia bacterium]|nr:cyclic nucleotide-binding domain-containing protein [Thermoanaerobaculia bacterium]